MTRTLKKRPTQKEVAERAGVSQGVVSQVLNDRQGAIRVNPETRERVLRAMHELGYSPNIAARSLVGGRSRIMGVFTYEPVFPTDTRNFFYPFLEGIEEAAAELNYDLLLHTRSSGNRGERRVYQDRTNRLSLADGTLMLGELGEPERRQEITRLISEGHPVVFIGRRDLPGLTLAWVAADYVLATEGAVNEFLALGHQGVLYLGGTRNHESAADREAGYRLGMEKAGHPARVVRLEPEDLTPEEVQTLLAGGCTGLLIENDDLAMGWLAACARIGLRAPEDHSFAVLGDPIRDSPRPRSWAALQLPRREMGREAVRLLGQLLEGGPPVRLRLACRWMPGDSLGPAPVALRPGDLRP